MYQQLAPWYDWSGALDFSQALATQTVETLAQLEVVPKNQDVLLDLGCGTGSIAFSLAQQGWRVHGVDISQAMLDEAQAKLQDHPNKDLLRSRVSFQQGDMRTLELTLPQSQDTVLAAFCYYDTLNHLCQEADLIQCFRRVWEVLPPGGWFFWDINSFENYQNFWQGYDQWEGPNVQIQYEGTFDEGSGKAEAHFKALTYDEGGHGALLEHRDFVQCQYYSPDTVVNTLASVGFRCEPPSPFPGPEYEAFQLLPDGAPIKYWGRAQKPMAQ